MPTEKADFLKGKTIAEADVVTDTATGDATVVLRFTDGTGATVSAWQKEGFPVEMSIEPAQN